jgi:four helix bundle protein
VAGAKRFNDLVAWQRCRELSDVIFEITECGPVTRNPRFRDQIRGAAQSAAPLIAEGFVRFLAGDFVRYLRMARAEIAEVQSDLDEAQARQYFSAEQLTRASLIARRAMSLTTRLLASKVKEMEETRRQRRKAGRRVR